MITRFEAHSAIKPGQVDVTWTWQSNAVHRPGLRLVRQQRSFARQVDQGLTLVDLADRFSAERQPWARIENSIYALDHPQDEGGLRQAAVAFYYGDAADSQPNRVTITYYDATVEQMVFEVINDVTRIESTDAAADPWDNVHTIDIFAAPGGGPEVTVGQVLIATDHAIENTRNQWQWTAPSQPPVTLLFGNIVPIITTVVPDTLVDEAEQFAVKLLTTQTQNDLAMPINRLTVSDTYNSDTGDWQRTAKLADMTLSPETVYYYSIFEPGPGGTYKTNRDWRVDAIPTRPVGFDQRMYALLPPVLQQMDEPTVTQQGNGDLRKFVALFGAAADQARSLMDQARCRHDLHNAPARVLPHMACWIGWQLDLTLDEQAQRRDIGMAPEVFETVGSLPNLQALVNRMTRWDCRVKEFVHNVFLTNAPESIRLWEIWQQRFNGAEWTAPEAFTLTDGFDGGTTVFRDAAGDLWLFWHADRSVRREIWLQRIGTDMAPRRAMLDTPDDDLENDFKDEYPAALVHGGQMRLFWSSNRKGAWDIWTRSYDGLPGEDAEQVTEHDAENRNPAAVVAADGRLWLFWQSNRRGPTDIWAQVLDGDEWSLPERVSTAALKHEKPAAVVDDTGRIWVFWVADEGDRRNLFCRVHDGDWLEARRVTSGAHRDEAPSAVFYDTRVWLFYPSDRSGFWQIWGQRFEDPDWSEPQPLTDETTADKEPAACVDDSGDICLFWRSQRRGRNFQSRTLDTDDADMLANLKTFQDRAHYTYDAGLTNGNWYGRGVVGLYLTPDTADSTAIANKIKRVSDFVQPFTPLPVRLVWLVESLVSDEVIDTDGLITEEVFDSIDE